MYRLINKGDFGIIIKGDDIVKRTLTIVLAIILSIGMLTGCRQEIIYNKYSYQFFELFDTHTQIIGYGKNKDEFTEQCFFIKERFTELHEYYDKYNNYENVNNIKTINDMAGIEPVKVEQEIIDLLVFSKDMYEKTRGKTNIAFGAVIEIWSDYRDMASADPENAQIPPMDLLLAADEHTDINKLIIDEENMTVYLEDPEMSLDVGSVAKGFATEIVAQEVEAMGLESAIISAGGNIRTIGKPMDNQRDLWGVGLRDPQAAFKLENNAEQSLDVVFVNDGSVVTSGDYERYYMVGDQVIHHMLDPESLMPGDYFTAVTVVTPDSGVADFMSTTMFLLPYEEGRQVAESMDIDVAWIFKDGHMEATDGMKEILQSYGATGMADIE